MCAALVAPLSASHANVVKIGEHRNFLVDGKPFYPVCVYHAHSWQKAADMGFNCVLGDGTFPTPPPAALVEKFTASANRDVLHSIDYSGIVRAGATEGIGTVAAAGARLPLFLNYIIDEPQYSPKATSAIVQAAVRAAKSQDPNHPTLIMGDRDGNVRNGMNAFADVIGTDVYPVRWQGQRYGYPPSPSLDASIGAAVGANVRSVGPNVPVMFAAQVESMPADPPHPQSGRYPTPDELRAMVYLALNHGAKGIFFYSMDDNYQGFRGFIYDRTLMEYLPRLVAELKAILPEYVDGKATRIESGLVLNSISLESNCRTTLVAVNPTGEPVVAQVPGHAARSFAPLEVYVQQELKSPCGRKFSQ
jgi:hypothetical protein